MKTVKQHLEKTNPERVPAFEKGAQAFAKQIVANFKDYEFYVGESMSPEGMVALLVSPKLSAIRFLDIESRLILCLELPRGRYHPILHLLEGRTQAGQDLKRLRYERRALSGFSLPSPHLYFHGRSGVDCRFLLFLVASRR